jgi:hypothetical protein
LSNETPFGKTPFPARVGAGDPVAVILKLEFVPTVNVALVALVKAGAVRWLPCAVDVPEPDESVLFESDESVL